MPPEAGSASGSLVALGVGSGHYEEESRELGIPFPPQGERFEMLEETLALAEPGGLIRAFVDEGAPMAQLLAEAAVQEIMPHYVDKLRAALEAELQKNEVKSSTPPVRPLVEPLSPRELEVLRLIAEGLSNDEIGKRLFLALDTVKGHNRRIFDKLQVQRRTEAVARARELGLL